MDTAASILQKGEETLRERAKDRDLEEERVMGKIVNTFNAATGRDLSEAEGWQFMLLLKMIRGANGKYRMDDYVDMASYAALFGECVSRTED